ncbi:MAG: creatininase family protein, partial [Pseudomonadota bacterium]
ATLLRLVEDIVDSLHRSGFKRILIVNGHGGNNPVGAMALDMMREREDLAIKFHNWWMAPRTWAKVQEIDPAASHASWMENFPWTRLKGTDFPKGRKEMIDLDRMRLMSPKAVREALGDGVFGGEAIKPDEVMHALWEVAVAETRDLLEGPWS